MANLKCNECGFEAKDEGELKRHREQKHGESGATSQRSDDMDEE